MTDSTVYATGTADSAAIQSAFAGMTVNGHARGTLSVVGAVALDKPVILDGGFTGLALLSGTGWAGESGMFRLVVNGSLTPAPGIGTALTVSGFRDAHIDVNLAGGGQPGDIGLSLANLINAEVDIAANGYAGTVLHADATTVAANALTQSRIRRVATQNCGQALYFAGINAFGSIDEVWDNNSLNGSEFTDCADITIGHWETWTPTSQTVGLLFEQCNNFSVGVLALGDRPGEAAVKITGGDFGSITKIRVSGIPGIATPTISGLKLVDVTSIEIGTLLTFNCAKGLHVQGGGGAGTGSIVVNAHRSLTADTVPLYIEAGSVTSAPIVDIKAAYRYCHAQAAYVTSTVTGGRLLLRGVIDTPNTLGNTSTYAVDCEAPNMVVDIAGLTQLKRAILAGAVHHVAPANLIGSSAANLGNPITGGN